MAYPSKQSVPSIQQPEPTIQQPETKKGIVIPNDISQISDGEDDTFTFDQRKMIMEAAKLAKFAQSALLYDDITTALQNLEKAAQLLKQLPTDR